MTKDSSVWRLLAALANHLDFQQMQVVDHWEADLFAVGVARTDDSAQLVYILIHGQQPGKYAYECEVRGGESYDVAAHAENVSFEQLVEVVRKHLQLGHRHVGQERSDEFGES